LQRAAALRALSTLRGLSPLRRATAVALALVATAAPARELHGRVTHVGDGDSLWLQTDPALAPIEVRLAGIDAPELCQAWGREARAALVALVDGREVVLRTVGVDTFGRTLGVVRVGGVDVNRQLVAHGHAWSGRWHRRGGPLIDDELHARRLHLGLHADAAAIEPREFRRRHGRCGAAPRSLEPVGAGGQSARESAQNRAVR
jgi:endonuclease YncB( thermonuclease family)